MKPDISQKPSPAAHPTEQRAATSRRNGARSRGPKTDAGKRIASRNSLKHALTAKKLHLPNEDPAAIAERTEEWVDCFRPVTPDARFLLDECVGATIAADRYHRAHDTAVANHMLEIDEQWVKEQVEWVESLRKHFAVDPAAAFAEIRTFPHGCRWLGQRLARYGAILEDRGCWSPAQAGEVVRLIGASPESERLHLDPEAYSLVLYNLCCQTEPPEAAIAALLEPGRRPEAQRGCDAAALRLGPERCRELLKRKLAEVAEMLVEDERRAEPGEAAERARLLDPASVLRDPDEARLFFRYQGEYRSTFHRAHKALMAVLKRDAEAEGEDSPPSDKAGDDAVMEAGSDPRNEPSSVTETPVDEGVESPAMAVEAGPMDEPGPEALAAVEEVGSDSRNGDRRPGRPTGLPLAPPVPNGVGPTSVGQKSTSLKDVCPTEVGPTADRLAGASGSVIEGQRTGVETISRNEPSLGTETFTGKYVDTSSEGEGTEDAGAREGRGSKERLARRSGEGRSPMDILAERFGDMLKGPGNGGKANRPVTDRESCPEGVRPGGSGSRVPGQDRHEEDKAGQSGAIHQANRDQSLVCAAATNPVGIEGRSVSLDVPAFEARTGGAFRNPLAASQRND